MVDMGKKTKKKGGRRISFKLSEEDINLLKKEFGSPSKGLRELISRYRFSLGPRNPTMRIAYHALLQEAEKTPSMPYSHVDETIRRAVDCGRDEALEIFRGLMREGYIDWDREKRGHVVVLAKRSEFGGLQDVLPPWMLKSHR